MAQLAHKRLASRTMAALAASDESVVAGAHHMDRCHEQFEEKCAASAPTFCALKNSAHARCAASQPSSAIYR
jgi:hypothetical protein